MNDPKEGTVSLYLSEPAPGLGLFTSKNTLVMSFNLAEGFTFPDSGPSWTLKDYVGLFIKIVLERQLEDFKKYPNNYPFEIVNINMGNKPVVEINLKERSIEVSKALKDAGDLYSYLFILNLERATF